MNSLTIVCFVVVLAVAQAGLIAGPAALWGAGPAVIRSAPLIHSVVAPRALISAHGLNGVEVDALGRIHEGQWIPDINEHLYDDGSYKARIW